MLLESIHHPEYKGTRETLSINLDNRSLLNLVDELQQKELSLQRDKTDKTRIRRAAQAFGFIDGPSPTKIRKVTKGDGKMASLPSVLHPNLSGYLQLEADLWSNLSPTDKSYIRLHNRSLRHSKDLPPPPSGVTIGERKDDGRGNGDVIDSAQADRQPHLFHGLSQKVLQHLFGHFRRGISNKEFAIDLFFGGIGTHTRW